MKILARAEKSKGCWFLITISFLFFLLRVPSFIEPYWYGDEGIYQVIGIALRNGRLLYRDIWDNKPPLLYVLYSIFSSDQFTIRLVSALFGIASIVAFYLLAEKLFKKRYVLYITTCFYALLFALPLLEGNIANSENFMLTPILFAGLFIYKTTNHESEKRKRLLLFSAGLLLSLAFLFKVVAVFDFAAFCTFLLFAYYPKVSHKNSIKKLTEYIVFCVQSSLELLTGFFLLIIITVMFFIFHGALSEFLHAAFIQNVGYVGYGNRLFFAQGFLILKLFLLFGWIVFLFLKRDKFPKQLLFILIWISFSLFNAYFSQRPYTHYVLVLLPSFCLLLGLCLDNTNKFLQRTTIGVCILLVIMIQKDFWLYKKNIAYYQNFFLFLTSQKTTASYRLFFDSKTPQDYEIASLLKLTLKKNDRIFVWGNNAQIYKLTNTLPLGKYTVVYHMLSSENSIKETTEVVSKTKPRYIIIMPDLPPLPYSLTSYSQKFIVNKAVIYERNF